MIRPSKLFFPLVAIGLLAQQPALAEEHWRGGEWRHEGMSAHWRGGRWERSWHDGRLGWWWVVGPAWYYYPTPVYPYPEPPVVVVTPPPPAQIPPQYFYYCPNPRGYYPAVPQCFAGWQLVPAGAYAPPPVAVAPPPPPPPPAAPSGGIDKSTGGTVLGAIGGGLAGSQIGHGSGKLAATAAGTILGALIGHEVGASLDRADQLAAAKAEHTAYAAPLGQPIAWNNPESGHSGTITPIREGQDQGGNYCREFQQTIVVNGKNEQATGAACRQPDGTWKLMDR